MAYFYIQLWCFKVMKVDVCGIEAWICQIQYYVDLKIEVTTVWRSQKVFVIPIIVCSR